MSVALPNIVPFSIGIESTLSYLLLKIMLDVQSYSLVSRSNQNVMEL